MAKLIEITEQEAQPTAKKGYRLIPVDDTESALKWSDVPMEALNNTPRSAGNFVSGIYNAVAHPIDTATSIGKLALGTAENVGGGIVNKAVGLFNPDLVALNDKLRVPSESENMADAVGGFYKQRYGSANGFKEALATDPVGVLADASTVLTGGGSLMAKSPKLASLANAATNTGNTVNPINLALKTASKGAKMLGNGTANIIGGIGTHTGGESLKQAYRAGVEGGDAAKALTGNMRGNTAMTDVLDEARAGLQAMAKEKAAAYRDGMAQVSGDKTVLDFNGIDKAVNDAFKVASFNGKATNTKAFDVHQNIADEINAWKQLNPNEFHTPEGLDALKQKISGIQEAIPFEQKTARAVAGKIYNSIKAEISKQAPAYSKTMQGYSDASNQITEIERALSLGGKSSVDTAMRKLQSLMRNNANTNYGNRLDLAKQLEKQGGVSLMPSLAGQSLNSWTPRGLGNAVAGATGGAGLVTMNPLAIPALALQSPRLMGEAAFKTGQVNGLLSDGVNAVREPLNAAGINPGLLANYLYQVDKQQGQGGR